MKLDSKFTGVIIKAKDSTIVPPDQYIVFLAKDNAVPAMLAAYCHELKFLGADTAQIEAVQAMQRRVSEWRHQHPELCKTPDIEPGECLLVE